MNKNGTAAWGKKICPACGKPVLRRQSTSTPQPYIGTFHFDCVYGPFKTKTGTE